MLLMSSRGAMRDLFHQLILKYLFHIKGKSLQMILWIFIIPIKPFFKKISRSKKYISSAECRTPNAERNVPRYVFCVLRKKP